MGERIGVFGGTFDPPHIGHLFAATAVGHELNLDRVLMVVANNPWQKADLKVTDAEIRLQMVELGIADVARLETSRIELDRGGPTYTADTLEQLHKEMGDDNEFFLVVGSDAAAGLDTWKEPETIKALATTVVLERPGKGAGGRPPAGWDYEVVTLPGLEVSGTRLRRRLSEGRPIDFLTPATVVQFIETHGLYRPTTETD